MKKLPVLLLIVLMLFTGFKGTADAVSPSPPPGMQEENSILSLGGELYLINRQHRISKAYEPDDLIQPDVQTRKNSLKDRILLRKVAANALERMFQTAYNEQGYILYAASGYRSYGIQQILFNSKVEEVGSREVAERRVAPAGTSEHQLGLAMDVQAPSQLNLNTGFGSTEEGKWVSQNAHRFGFILRYKEEWRDITGYSEEPWHIRYVGIAHAAAIFEMNIPLETYTDLALRLPEYVLTGASHVLLTGLVRDMMEGREPEKMSALIEAADADHDAVLRAATAPYLQDGMSYEQALWYAYPTPRPTSAPRVDLDEETRLSPEKGG